MSPSPACIKCGDRTGLCQCFSIQRMWNEATYWEQMAWTWASSANQLREERDQARATARRWMEKALELAGGAS